MSTWFKAYFFDIVIFIYTFYVSTCKQTGISSLVKKILQKSYKLFLSLSFAEFLATDVFKEV